MEAWPKSDIEQLGHCPVCGSARRNLLHANLRDKVFFCAPGAWEMQRCLECRAAYLDPRPTSSSMHLAYQNYYTHEVPAPLASDPVSLTSRLRKILGNGYRNWRYGTCIAPASKLGVLAAVLLPGLRRSVDDAFRYIPRYVPGARLLDVGFGSGAFLDLAATAGWDVAGVDIDPAVVASARARGLNVRQGGIEAWDDQPERFDAITISHVIEHVHDPVHTLQVACKLLKRGGYLWIDTPNLESFGHAYFQANWRGLETPRHLVIFDADSIKRALNEAGFEHWESVRRTSVAQHMFLLSERMRLGLNPYGHEPAATRLTQKFIAVAGTFSKKRSEFITLIARKS